MEGNTFRSNDMKRKTWTYDDTIFSFYFRTRLRCKRPIMCTIQVDKIKVDTAVSIIFWLPNVLQASGQTRIAVASNNIVI